MQQMSCIDPPNRLPDWQAQRTATSATARAAHTGTPAYQEQKWSKSCCAQCACKKSCWCWPVQMKQLPLPARLAPEQSRDSADSHAVGGITGGVHVAVFWAAVTQRIE